MGFINRRDLLKEINFISGELSPILAPNFYQLLKKYEIIQKPDQHFSLSELQPEHLAKTITAGQLKKLCAEFAFPQVEGITYKISYLKEGFGLSSWGHPPRVDEETITRISIITKATIIHILSQIERPLTENEIGQEAKEKNIFLRKTQLDTILEQLQKAGKVGRTLDNEYFLAEKKENFLKEGTLFVPIGAENLLSKNGLEKKLKTGKTIEVFTATGSIYYWQKTFQKLERVGHFTRVEAEQGKSCFFLKAEVPLAIQQGKIVLGQKENGEKVYILAQEKAIIDHRKEIFHYEIDRLIEELESNHQIPPEEKESFREKFGTIFELWERFLPPGSPYQNLFLAQKVAQMGGSSQQALAATLSIIPHLKAKEALANQALFPPAEAEETLEMNYDYKVVRGFPFRLPKDDHHFIQNFMWMLIVLIEKPESFRLLFADKLKDLSFAPQVANPQEKYLYPPLAERFGFTYLPEDLRNLFFQIENPEKYEKYQQKIEEKIGMSLAQANQYLAEFTSRLKEELAKQGIPKEVIEIKFRRKSEYATYEKIELRKQRTWENIPDLLGIKIIVNCQTGRGSKANEEKNLEYLDKIHRHLQQKYQPQLDQVEDAIQKPRASGWQAITYEDIQTKEGKKIEIQLMSKVMYENEKFLKIRQAHWYFALERELRHLGLKQKFDEYPLELLERLTGNFEHDYPLIRDYLLSHWNFVFFVKDGEKLTKKENLIDTIRKGEAALQIKRVSQGSTPVDLATDLSHYGGAEIYTLGLDKKDGIQVVPVKKYEATLPDLGVNYSLNNGEIVILKSAKDPFAGKTNLILKAKESAKKPSTIINLRKLLLDESLERDIAHGKEMISRFPEIQGQLRKIQIQYKFENADDFYAAVGAGLLAIDKLEELAHGVVVKLESSNGQQILRVKAPDIKGLTYAILANLPSDISMAEVFSQSYYLLGEKRAEIIFKFSPPTGIKVKTIQESLKRLLESYSGREYPPETTFALIRIQPQEGKWQIEKLLKKLSDDNINIIKIDLLQEKSEGMIEIEIPQEVYYDQETFRVFEYELKEFPAVIEIR